VTTAALLRVQVMQNIAIKELTIQELAIQCAMSRFAT